MRVALLGHSSAVCSTRESSAASLVQLLNAFLATPTTTKERLAVLQRSAADYAAVTAVCGPVRFCAHQLACACMCLRPVEAARMLVSHRASGLKKDAGNKEHFHKIFRCAQLAGRRGQPSSKLFYRSLPSRIGRHGHNSVCLHL